MSLASQTGRCAVLGSPIAHSLSPDMHRAGYRALGLVGWTFSAIECTAEQLPAVVRARSEFAGFAVTMPGKRIAAEVAETRSARVQLLGVANTLLPRPSGWYAENTDVDGIAAALTAVGCPAPDSALVLGGGGTALAALAALGEAGTCAVTLAGRSAASTATAAALAGQLGMTVTCVALDEVAGCFDALISALPVAAFDSCCVSELARGLDVPAVVDVLYHPWPTPLAAAFGARSGGAGLGGAGSGGAGLGGAVRVVGGLEVLLGQGARQFELFCGRPAPVAQMRAALAMD